MLIRDARPDDVEDVVALVESAYRGEASRAGWTTEAHLLEGRRTDDSAVADLVAAGSLLLAVEGAAGLLGCCQLERRPGYGYFGTFAVRPTGQGSGVGSALLADAERRTRAWGGTRLEMTVIDQRADLIAWYERRGYARTGELRPFPYGDERFGRPRRDDLVFAVLSKQLEPDADGVGAP